MPASSTAPSRPWDVLLARLPATRWRRGVLARRVLAGALVVAAAVLAFRPAAGAGEPVLVAVRDLPAGVVLGPADLAVRPWPDALVPTGVLRATADATGRVLAGPVRAGEPVTDLRLAGPALAAAASGLPDAVAVPVRLTDPGVAGLLVAGNVVDVVTPGAGADEAVVLAEGAVVTAVLPADSGGVATGSRGRIVLVALPPTQATRLAAAALTQQVAVTLRQQNR
ncbi:SAF domain-containing protein [Pseudonocardia sp. N23]|uniref:SAF domain-containing protein n=1 Tax=Pseudonocardia sp. N23 TaxID=1987376 RepID=UPI000BFE7A16|nr:SAF domain-containing protein [Pseudonocardia sp. N23]GAY12692.1 heat shock protein 22.5 [Pseudonocardia sp. N23]